MMIYKNLIVIMMISLAIITSGCVNTIEIAKPTTIGNATSMHSHIPFYTVETYNIMPGCYELDAKTLTPESEFNAYVGMFSYKYSKTDRFGNTNEEWKNAPAPRLNSDDPLINFESKICSSDRYTVCHRKVFIADRYVGDPVRNLKIEVRCKGDCQLNVSHCD